MVSAAFSAKGKSEITVLTGKQASGHYAYTPLEFLLPFSHLDYGPDYIFQQDNEYIHSSYLTVIVLKSSK